jgi:ribose transport system substrate-binding protein
MKKNWGYSFILLLLVGSLFLAGCSNTSSGESDSKKLKIGYVVNFGSAEWYQNTIKGAEATAKEKGFDFEWVDSNMNLSKQITEAENLLTKGVDVLVLSPVDPKGLSTVMDKAKELGVPVITETNSIPGTKTTIGVKNIEAGELIGKAAGEYIKANFKEKAKVLIVGLPSQQDTRDRVEGFKKGLTESGAEYEIVQEVDGKGTRDVALKVSTDVLTAHKDVNVIYGINDDSAIGGQQAYQESGLEMNKLLTIGFGVEGIAGKEALTSDGPFKAALGMFPEYVGKTMVEVAEKAVKKEKLPERTVTPMTVLTPDNLSDYYTKNGKNWNINFDNVLKIIEN